MKIRKVENTLYWNVERLKILKHWDITILKYMKEVQLHQAGMNDNQENSIVYEMSMQAWCLEFIVM